MKKTDELRQKKAKLVADARAIHKRATDEKRDLSAEENEQFNKIMDVALGDADRELQEAEKSEARHKKLADEEARLQESQGRRSNPGELDPGTAEHDGRRRTGERASGRYRELRHKPRGAERERIIRIDTQMRTGTEAYEKAFYRALTQPVSSLPDTEVRDLQADSDTAGGFLVAPQVFVAQLIQAVDDMVFIRGLANILPTLTTSESVGIPTREADIADSDWTTELGTGNDDTALSFGKRELRPHPLAKLIKISKKLMRAAALNPEAIALARMAYKFAITMEKAYMTGSGAQQPLGLFTANADGVPTSRDISTGNTTTAIVADGLINAKYSLKGQYWNKAQWLFHRDAMKAIAKLKDGEGQYLWRTGLVAGDPELLLGRPINMSEYVPNTFATGLYVGMFADFSNYWIVDSLAMQVQVLIELYAATNQNGYIGRLETDGQPVLSEAFARVTLA